ncbi:hypothetical protein [Streptomyces griseorubiginosus]|uniref:hypothetical protein n=1 Tax=Streptomyces griseorubiginosus TaxID=67304 RepID=UPI002E806A16|nr:hypothetical protein [Streptomyces griseorubiginosus]WUB47511.1 hypothetical protein OHN19_30925 [Streptomyces griseorubiginosus]WUB56036.1 hypothetical protein OG942_30935 [Streptomyces griseorubiginosus]
MRPARCAVTTSLLILSALTLVGCGSDDDSAAAAPSSTATAASAQPSAADDAESAEAAGAAAEEDDDDTSVVDFLRAAGVGDDLVNQLGEVGDANGYGLGEDVATDLESRRRLATTQVETCRNVAVGHRTWEGIQASDMSAGASQEQAAAMADFLRTEFCPHVAPYKEAALPKQTLNGAAQDAHGGRGLASPLSWWDARYPRVSWSKACARQTGQPLGDPVAYRLAEDAVVCATVPPAKSLKKHLVSVDIVFASPVGEARARDAVLTLLPSDATPDEETEGTNADWSYLEGGCLNINFRSDRLKDVAAEVEKDAEPWASALYYSDGATSDGAVGAYTGKIKQILLSTDKNEPGLTGDLTC